MEMGREDEEAIPGARPSSFTDRFSQDKSNGRTALGIDSLIISLSEHFPFSLVFCEDNDVNLGHNAQPDNWRNNLIIHAPNAFAEPTLSAPGDEAQGLVDLLAHEVRLRRSRRAQHKSDNGAERASPKDNGNPS